MEYSQPKGAAPGTSFVDGNPATGTKGSAVPATALEEPQREILKVIVEAGIPPSHNDLTQLWQAIQNIAGVIANNTVTNVLNSLSFNLSVPFALVSGINALQANLAPVQAAYFAGQIAIIKIVNENTGGVTLQFHSLGFKTVLNPDGSPIAAGALRPNMVAVVIYDGTNFQLVSTLRPAEHGFFAGFPSTWVSTTQITIGLGAAKADTKNHVIRLDSAMTKSLNVVWSAGSGNGMKSGVAFGNDTWHVYAIGDSTGVLAPDIWADNAYPPVSSLPAGYDCYRRVESLVVTGSAIKRYTRNGDEVSWYDGSNVIDISYPNYQPAGDLAPILLAISVPKGAPRIAKMGGHVSVAGPGITRGTVANGTGPTPVMQGASYYGPGIRMSAFQGYGISVTDWQVETDSLGRVWVAIYNIDTIGWGAQLWCHAYTDKR